MSRAPRLTREQIIARLPRAGFEVVRIRGSHHRLAHRDGRSTTVPVHGTEIIGPGLLSRIVKDVALSRDQFEALA